MKPQIVLFVVFFQIWKSNAVDWDARFQAEKVKANNLITRLEALNARLTAAVNANAQLNEKDEELFGKITEEVKKLPESTVSFKEIIDDKFNLKMEKSTNVLKTQIKNNLIPTNYDKCFIGLKNIMDGTIDNYELRSKGVRNSMKNGNKELDKLLGQINPRQIDMSQRVTTVVSDLTPGEKIQRLDDIKGLQTDFYKIAKQVQMDAFHEEEKQRSDGNSGIKQIRTNKVGGENYFASTHTGRSFSAIHGHQNSIRTVGMGEFIGVLNGVEFRTRHNDYRLSQPITNDKTYHKVENIEFPPIPPEVTNAGSIPEQAREMREWFKAFYEQDYSVRDYRPYFKPVMTYLEGSWQVGKDGDPVDEPFASDRHHIDATSWLDLQEKVRFTSYAGAKSLLENLAHLPTKIIRFTEDNEPVIAQWNYRLLCHPIEGDLPTSYLKLVPDITVQKSNKYTEEQYRNSRAAKFDIYGIDINGERVNKPLSYSFLDSIMEQIPGKDNYGAHIDALPFGDPSGEYLSANPKKSGEKLNAAYYHRAFLQKDSNGEQVHFGQRGFSDHLYMAHTTQDRIAYMSYNITQNGKPERIDTKVSYAVPVEIIYLTPLNGWNPYDLVDGPCLGLGHGSTPEKPINRTCSKKYYLTPDEFYSGKEMKVDAADTDKGAIYIETKNHGVQPVCAAGTRITFPPIAGIPHELRQRYPIMPVYGEGSAAWKKMDALEELLQIKYSNKIEILIFVTGISHSEKISGHQHIIRINGEAYKSLINRKLGKMKVTSEEANGHVHQFELRVNNQNKIYIDDCKGNWQKDPTNHPEQVCFDYHGNSLTPK